MNNIRKDVQNQNRYGHTSLMRIWNVGNEVASDATNVLLGAKGRISARDLVNLTVVEESRRTSQI